MLKDRISKKISRFYYNVDIAQELESDDDSEDLEEISEDEYQDNIKELLEDNNKQLSQDQAKNIYKRMSSMSETYQKIALTMEKNL